LQQDVGDTYISNGTQYSGWHIVNNSMVNFTDQSFWQNVVGLNGWSASGSYAYPGYIMMPDGTVRMRGAIISGTITDGTVVFVLASGYRPANQIDAVVAGGVNGSFASILIETNGNVLCEGLAGKGSFIGLDNVTFPVNI